LSFDLPIINNEDIDIVPYDFYGHFSITGGLKIPFEKLLDEWGKKLDDIIEIEGRFGLMLDLGTNKNLYEQLLNILTKLKDRDMFVSASLDLIKSASKIGIQLNNIVKLKLNELTSGFLPDIEVEISKTSLGVFLKEEKKILPGIYLYFNSSNSPFGLISRMLQSVFENFEFIFEALGINPPSIPRNSFEVSIIINAKYVAFEAEAEHFAGVTCIFDRKTGDGSCNIGLDFFSFSKNINNFLVLDGLNWVLKKATKFFERTGEEIMKFGIGSKNFVARTSKAAYKFILKQSKQALDVYNKATQELKKLGENVSESTKQAYLTVIGRSKRILEKSHRSLRDVTKKASELLFMTMDTLWNFANDLTRLKYLKKIGKKLQSSLKNAVKRLENKAKELENEVFFH